MSWLLLFFAGCLEVIWAIGLKYTEGFTKLFPSIITVIAMIASVYLLGVALRTIPLGTAYTIWVGIGAVGAAIAGIILFNEPATLLKIISLLFVIAGVVGLKIASAI